LLAALVRRHRRSFPVDAFAHLPREIAPPAERLCVLLRLAVVLHRGRSRQPLPPLSLEVNARRVALRFPSGWLDEHPLTRADLEAEARYLKKAGFRLEFG
jgi:exopolyphosphatase/guanosine-5'-triphosphate,3'-diphosphate pyrophosphatase